MSRNVLNLGILAHVDAGKTTLTERLLYRAGAIDAVGSVDAGTTQTDTLALERQRGITIKAAVVSFAIGGTTVNLIDTPGHPDFVAEVERALAVLDGAVLVVSAVEGVQPQTKVLWRALQRLGIPAVCFVNKTDRAGADPERAIAAIRERLAPASMLPVFVGSARTGAGVDELAEALPRLLPRAGGDPDGEPAGIVFKIERGRAGEKVAYVRLFSGTIRVRDRLRPGGREEKVTAIEALDGGRSASAGQIARVRGLAGARIGDRFGPVPRPEVGHQFPLPTLEAVVAPDDSADAPRLRVALGQLAEQDPLIDVRQDDERRELTVSLYGEVQKEVVQATLAADFGIAASFRGTTPIHVDRPARPAEAGERMHADGNPFLATVGLRVEPGDGVGFRLAVDSRSLPLYVYKRRALFEEDMARTVAAALRDGPNGRRVTDCAVTMTECVYSSPDGPPATRGPLSAPADFRGLVPVVLRRALERAGTVECEPLLRVRLELPPGSLGVVLPALTRLGAAVEAQAADGLTARLPAARLHELQVRLPSLTGGEGVLESEFAGYRPVTAAGRRSPS
jgi:ribosomal protection tetracycline resistance protein